MVPKFETTKISDGLEFGDGAISRIEREALPGNEDLAQVTDSALKDERLLVPVDKDEHGNMLQDDGCGDGRPVGGRLGAVFAKAGDQIKSFARSLNRAKVFGGGATMATAMRIGMGKSAGESLADTFQDGVDQMIRNKVDFGAHTDNYAHGPNCGCGAIDKAPAIIEAVSAYKSEIAGTIASLVGTDTEEDVEATHGQALAFNTIFDNYDVKAKQNNAEYKGMDVMKGVVDTGKIVKELVDDHRETRIVLNIVEGTTIDQEFVRQYTGSRAQVFAVDVWRLKQLAERLYADPADQRTALLSELTYTLGTAAVLTKGDLPVYTIAAAMQEANALIA